MSTDSFARTLRTRRLHHHGARLLVVPLDHSVTDGPVVRDGGLDRLVGELAANGADAVVLHKGAVRRVHPRRFEAMSLVVHLSGGTARAPDPDDKCLVGSVDEALRLGADAVSIHVNIGSRHEQRQLADLGAVAAECGRWGLPLLAMMYPRGPKITDPDDPEVIAHVAAIAADLGADLVKVPYPGSVPAMREVVGGCPVPLLVAGGAQRQFDELVRTMRDALHGGAAGFAVGRNIIRNPTPGPATARLSDLTHDRLDLTPLTAGAPR